LLAPRKSPFVAFAQKVLDAAKTVTETVLPRKRADDVDPVSPPPLPDPPPPVPVVPRSLTAVAEAAIAATVVVEVEGAIGAGFFVHPSGLLVTARHVVEHRGVSCRTIALRFANGHECSATVFRSHRSLDYALAWADLKKPVPTLPLGAPVRLRHADTLLAVGHPSALRFTVSSGVVSNPAATINGIDYIQTDTAIDPGNSGGPLVNVLVK
jgi:putative serine protease PepD